MPMTILVSKYLAAVAIMALVMAIVALSERGTERPFWQ
jgi:hypothetical protein